VLIQTSFAEGWGYCCASGPTGMAAREAIMSDEHLDNLRQARAQLIEQRRVFVRVLAGLLIVRPGAGAAATALRIARQQGQRGLLQDPRSISAAAPTGKRRPECRRHENPGGQAKMRLMLTSHETDDHLTDLSPRAIART
jgi:hypothetical protein